MDCFIVTVLLLFTHLQNANMDIQADKKVNSEDGEPCEIVPMTAEDGDSAEGLQVSFS